MLCIASRSGCRFDLVLGKVVLCWLMIIIINLWKVGVVSLVGEMVRAFSHCACYQRFNAGLGQWFL